jgi:hypothetical protein
VRIKVPQTFGITALIVTMLACTERKPAPTGELQSAARIQLDTNRAVEVLGLRWWSLDMLQDSLAKYAPGEALDSANIATVLRDRLHFADAAVHRSEQVFDENETAQFTIAVREPRDSARVHYASQTLDTIPRVPEWKPLTSRLTGAANSHLLEVVAGSHLEGPARTTVDSSSREHPVTTQVGYAFESPEDSVVARPLIDVIEKRVRPRDFTTAIQTIDGSTSLPDRIVAVLILANFPKRDEAWRALLKAAVGQRQGEDAALAARALDAMGERFPHVVDWTPMAATIHDVLDGTALAALPAVAGALANTGASPRDAAAWLARGGEMLVAYSESANSDLSEPAHRLLVALRGSDLGSDLEPWRAWIRGL